MRASFWAMAVRRRAEDHSTLSGDGDDVPEFMDVLEHAHRQNIAVTQAAAAAIGKLAGHCDVVYDGIVGPWLLDSFLAATHLDHLHYVMLLPPLETCLCRVSSRQGHGFADLDAAAHMWREFDQAEIDSRHILDNDQRTPAELARTLVDKLSDATIRYP